MKYTFESKKTWVRAAFYRSIIPVVLLWLPSPWIHGDSDNGVMATALDPILFLPGLISNDLNNRDLTISAAGDELYTSVVSLGNRHSTIVVSHKLPDGNWSDLEVASFSGQYSDLEPALSSDGNTLYFASRRPIEGTAEKDWDIWKTNRISGSWTTPVNLGEPVNSSGDEFYPSVTRTGSLYFTASREGGLGKEDLYRSGFESGRYQTPINLGNKINSPAYEFNGYIDPDEKFLVFGSAGRNDSLGSGDLYISFRNAEGNFEAAIHLPAPINSSNLDYCPFVSQDGEYLYFTSDRDTLKTNLQANYSYLDLARHLHTFGNGSGDIYRVPLRALIETALELQ